MKFKIVEVTWFDSQTTFDVLFLDEIDELKPIETKSIGYLLGEYPDYIVLGFMVFGESHAKHFQVIPKGVIKGVKELFRK